MKRILGTNTYTGKPLEIIQNEIPSGFIYRILPEQSEECFLKEAESADYILAGGRVKLTKAVLERAQHLKMIQRSGVGLDSLDLEAIKAKGIPLYVNQGVNAESVAEHTLLLILACLRRLPVINEKTKNGIWKKQEQGIQTSELKGKTVGIIGMGNIARRLAELLKPFKVQILYTNLFQLQNDIEEENNMRFAEIPELLALSDIISIHCALTDETAKLINAETIKQMKRGAILINTARGGIVDSAAVADALNSGQLSFAGLDVHDTEPIPEDYPLKHIENVILTPHVAGVTIDSFKTMMHDAFRNIVCFEHGDLASIEQYRVL